LVTSEKKKITKQLFKKFSKAKSVVFADYSGFSVKEMNELRAKFRESDIEFRIIKNTLAKIALDKAKIRGLEEYLVGPTSAAFSYSEPIMAAKILKSFNINGKNLTIKAGYVEGEIYGHDEMVYLASLPSREELITSFIRYLSYPLYRFVHVLRDPLVNLINILGNIKKSEK
jgi:large subunit ribosomal protein L10